MTQQATLHGERLFLRPLRASDAGLVTLYAGDRRVAEMTTSIPHPLPPGAAEAFVERSLLPGARERVWVMDAAPIEGPELVGLISAEDEGAGVYEMGYWVGPPFWNTGYATEALALLADHLLGAGAARLRA
ncbi:MAG: GNAT family N-acetyltransferase, partial [Pseudomonadota bacterium]